MDMVKLDDLKKMGGNRANLSELPVEFIGTVINERIQQDRMGREALYWDIELDDGRVVTQKFTKLHISELARALEKLGITETEELIKNKKKVKFRQVVFRTGNPRWLPVEIQ